MSVPTPRLFTFLIKNESSNGYSFIVHKICACTDRLPKNKNAFSQLLCSLKISHKTNTSKCNFEASVIRFKETPNTKTTLLDA